MNYQENLKIQLDNYPDSVIVTPSMLAIAHKGDKIIIDQIMWYMENEPSAVYYILPIGSYGAMPDRHCNGIRYGLDGNYTSLPNIIAGS